MATDPAFSLFGNDGRFNKGAVENFFLSHLSAKLDGIPDTPSGKGGGYTGQGDLVREYLGLTMTKPYTPSARPNPLPNPDSLPQFNPDLFGSQTPPPPAVQSQIARLIGGSSDYLIIAAMGLAAIVALR